MATNIIYHDFRNTNTPVPSVMLTAPLLNKGRRLIKAVDTINAAIIATCIFLCGICSAVSILILIRLSLG